MKRIIAAALVAAFAAAPAAQAHGPTRKKVEEKVTAASGGTAPIVSGETFYRIAEMHFADEAAYRAYRDWFTDHPIPLERGPAGRTRFRFYVTATPTEVTRESVAPSGR